MEIYVTVAVTILGIITSILTIFTFIRNGNNKKESDDEEYGSFKSDIQGIKNDLKEIKEEQKNNRLDYQKILVEQGKMCESLNSLKERMLTLEKNQLNKRRSD